MDYYEQCSLCPRKCHVNRHICTGFCGAGDMLKVARADLYFGEEPCISGKSGSGAIFFSGCNLKCEFCLMKILELKYHLKNWPGL